jgi:hypothetical protein
LKLLEGIVRLNQIVLLLALFSLLSGCSDRLYWLAMTPEKQVLDGYDEDQALRDHVAKLAKGPTVKGSACTWFTMGLSMMKKTRHSAYADTMGKAGPTYDALIDVVQTSTSYPPLLLYCVSLEGTAVRNETQHAALDSSAPSAKPKGKSH